MKFIFSIVLAALSAVLFSTNTSSAQTGANTDSVKVASFKVRNLHCNGDMPTIKKRLLNQDGVDEVAFTERKDEISTFTITYHSSAINEAALAKAVESTPGCDDQSETPYRVVRERARKTKN
jgi:copper chaperone CopZ